MGLPIVQVQPSLLADAMTDSINQDDHLDKFDNCLEQSVCSAREHDLCLLVQSKAHLQLVDISPIQLCLLQNHLPDLKND